MYCLALGRTASQKTSSPRDKKIRMIDNVSTNPTVGRPKPKTTPNIQKMISRVAEKVASDVVKEMEHKKGKKKSKVKTTKIKKAKHKSRKKTRSDGLAFADKKSIQSEFSHLMSELESVKKSIAKNPRLNTATQKPTSPTPATKRNGAEMNNKKTLTNNNPDLSRDGKSVDAAKNPALAEAVNILRNLANPSLPSHPTKPVTQSALAKAVSILSNLKKSRNIQNEETDGNNKEALFKAINILKNLNEPKHQQPTKMRKDFALSLANMEKPYNSPNLNQNNKPSEVGSGIAKAIEILREFQSPKLFDSSTETVNKEMAKTDGMKMENNEESIFKSSTIPGDSEGSYNLPKSPNLENEKIRTEKMPELKTSVNRHTIDVFKHKEKEMRNPSLSKAPTSSTDLQLEHLIDKVADQAAKEVENSIENHQNPASTHHVTSSKTSMPKLENDKNSDGSSASIMKALDNVQRNKLNNLDKIKETKYSTVSDHQRTKDVPQSKRMFPLPTLTNGDNSVEDAGLGPEIPSAQELRTLMRFRNKWNVKVGADRKKVDIPHNGFGECFELSALHS